MASQNIQDVMTNFEQSYTNLQQINQKVSADDAHRQNFSTTILGSLNTINEKIKELPHKIQLLKDELNNSRTAIASNNNQLTSNQSDLASLTAKVNQLQQERDAIEQKYNALETASQTQIRAHDAEIQSLQSQLQQIQTQNQQLNDEFNKLTQSNLPIDDNITQIRQTLQQNVDRINTLQQEIDSREQVIQQLNQQILNRQKDASTAQSQLEHQILLLQGHANDLTNQIMMLTEQNAKLKETIGRATLIINEATTNLERLNSGSMNAQSLQQVNDIIGQIDQTIQEINSILDNSNTTTNPSSNQPQSPSSNIIPQGNQGQTRPNINVLPDNTKIQISQSEKNLGELYHYAQIQINNSPQNTPTQDFLELLLTVLSETSNTEYIKNIITGYGIDYRDNKFAFSDTPNTRNFDLLTTVDQENGKDFTYVDLFNAGRIKITKIIKYPFNKVSSSLFYNMIIFLKQICVAPTIDQVKQIYKQSPYIMTENNLGLNLSKEWTLIKKKNFTTNGTDYRGGNKKTKKIKKSRKGRKSRK